MSRAAVVVRRQIPTFVSDPYPFWRIHLVAPVRGFSCRQQFHLLGLELGELASRRKGAAP
jgi:hypothetical protein